MSLPVTSALMAWKKKYGIKRKRNYRWRKRTTIKRRRYYGRKRTSKYSNRLASKNLYTAKQRSLAPRSYANSRIFNTFKLRAFNFGPVDFNTATPGVISKGHWTYDFTLNDLMDQNDLNEMKEYRNWIVKSIIITYCIRDFNNMVKFTELGGAVANSYQFDRLGTPNSFRMSVAVFDNSALQTDCALLDTVFTGTNMTQVVSNKVQLANTKLYKDLSLNGKKVIFKWYNSNATSANIPAMNSIPSLTDTIDGTWALGTPVGRTLHGNDFQWVDANYYFNPSAAIYKANVIVYQTMNAVIYCKNRNPVP